MKLYRDEAIVLRTYRFGEADRIVVLLTRGRGKVRAVAKGVRKTASKFGSRLEPTSHVAIQLYEGRELDTVTQVERLDVFRSIREDLDRVSRATVMLEAVDQVCQERQPDPRLYQMLLGGLRTVAGTAGPLVAPAFLLKLLAHEGLQPVVDRCVHCGVRQPLVTFDVDSDGLCCVDHRHGTAVTPDVVALLQRILGGQLGAALNEGASEATAALDVLATRLMERHLERRLRSATLLDH